jgi:hypothetical protein
MYNAHTPHQILILIRKLIKLSVKGSMLRSTEWEGSIYSHVFEHNQLLLAAHLLLQALGFPVGTEAASVHHRQFCAEEV